MSGREAVHSAVSLSAALAKPAVVAVPVHRVTDPRVKCTPEQSRFAEHLARRDRAFEWTVAKQEVEVSTPFGGARSDRTNDQQQTPVA